MTTYSQLVDELIQEFRRPDMAAEVKSYVNQTIRELHFSQDRNAMVLYSANYCEDTLVVGADSKLIWEAPNPGTFQKLESILYLDVTTRLGEPVWPEMVVPGRHLSTKENYVYRVGNSFVFSGAGGPGCRVAIGYYRYPPSLHYFAPDKRPAWKDFIGWNYAPAWVQEPETRASAEVLVTNWLLERWEGVISEGVRAKLYKRVSDTERARTSYSLYSQMRQHVMTSEIAVPGIS